MVTAKTVWETRLALLPVVFHTGQDTFHFILLSCRFSLVYSCIYLLHPDNDQHSQHLFISVFCLPLIWTLFFFFYKTCISISAFFPFACLPQNSVPCLFSDHCCCETCLNPVVLALIYLEHVPNIASICILSKSLIFCIFCFIFVSPCRGSAAPSWVAHSMSQKKQRNRRKV